MKITDGFYRALADTLATPYLEVDVLRLQRNIQQMQQIADAAGVKLRPHGKTHKSVTIAAMQQAAGATGITVSKPQEGIAFIEGGIKDVLLAYPVVRAETLQPLLATAQQYGAQLGLIVADLQGVAAIAQAVQQQGFTALALWIKVDVGLGRVGVDPHSEAALVLAQAIDAAGLTLAGILSHAGQAYGAGNREAIAQIALHEAELMNGLCQRLRQAGFSDCQISTGSTPTALGAPIAPGYVEIRPGNYALCDLTALRLGLCSADDLAMTVVSRVVAVNDRYAIIDAGSKALSSDRGPHGTSAKGFGLALSLETGELYEVEKMSEEHGFVPHNGVKPALGSLVRVFPNHSCAVMAQFSSGWLRQPDGSATPLTVDARGLFL